MAQWRRQVGEIDGATALEPVALALVEGRLQRGFVAAPGEDRQAAVDLAGAAARQPREMAKQQQPAQQREDGFREHVAIAHAERSLRAKEIGDHPVGRMLEAQHLMHELGRSSEQGLRRHRRIIRPDPSASGRGVCPGGRTRFGTTP